MARRMIAATEYFKTSGQLPPWARAELESWGGSHERHTPVLLAA